MTKQPPKEKGDYPVSPEGHLSSESLLTATHDKNAVRVRMTLMTPLDGKKSKVFVEVMTTRGRALVDAITGSLYSPETGRCWSSPNLHLVVGA